MEKFTKALETTKQLSITYYFHIVIRQTLFELNFKKHLQKDNLITQTEFPKLKEFLIRLQQSQKEVTKSMKKAQKNMNKIIKIKNQR